uniref:exodeoxyribonuclease III n=1 Tax=Sinocyclocheilus anshuiensis TaxID=1608454 RepID=A0A671RIW1_9TELE
MVLNVMSWNVNGLNGTIKRTKCLDYLRSKRVSIALIQESNLKACDVHRFQNRYYKLVSFPSDKKSKGVLIMMARRLPFSIHCSRSDADGRITYILVTWSNIKCAFVSVYALNEYDSLFYQQLVRMSLSLNDYHLVIGGDFNAVHDPILDRSQISNSDQTSSKLFNDFIKQVNVCDVWQLRNEAVKDYTFFSHPRHSCFVSLSRTSSQAKFLLMLSGLVRCVLLRLSLLLSLI